MTRSTNHRAKLSQADRVTLTARSHLHLTEAHILALGSMVSYSAGVKAQLGLGDRILSVCLSVTRVLCDNTKEHVADILIPHKRVSK